MESVLEIKNLNKSFGSNHVLRNFSLTLYKGENIVVLGRSGSGKSVMIKCAVGLMKYDSGSIKVLGQEIKDLNAVELDALRVKMGFVFQSSALYDSMTVGENLEFPLRRNRPDLRKSEMDDIIKETLDNVGLYYAINLLPSELSGGMKKRVGLARALVLKPEIVFYDEPTTGLDPFTSSEISKLMLEMQNKYNTSSITISHDMYCARITGNRLVALIDGTNYAEGTFEELQNSEDEKIKTFFTHGLGKRK
ncbi:MAG: ATP-binding cassette domain-containing protein [Bacteroidetes bacterium]|nr:MAG: ATP-binding cassette domain-containing protein [Bacteroidota bacterium]REK05362.1 MAG: ATP-binding cassette domain-containing protein [Bacteroidota bacterium]REK32736.1 MAG: ATP-binding cassette domain-containing protein [Bacteroidota bacterium]REK49069.1 MAG: ATP-binding cassette domain-containing protein [Bacteroidota bacterium]